MTQYIRPPKAFNAVTAPVATSASPGSTDQRNLHFRLASKLGWFKGTRHYGSLRRITLASVAYSALLMSDGVYAAASSAGVDFSDMLYNSASAEGTYSTTSDIPTGWNPGVHRQIVVRPGNSLTEGPTGSNSYPELNELTSHLGLMGAGYAGGPVAYVLAESGAYMVPNRAYDLNALHYLSRIVFNYGHGGWRLTDVAGYTYTAGSPWLDNIQHMANIPVYDGQQLALLLQCNTNDVRYAQSNGNGGMMAVPAGTPGYTYAGAVNYIESALIPYLAAFKALYSWVPDLKIIWKADPARLEDATLNAIFVEIIAYIKAHKATLGIDIVVDTSQMPEFDPRNYMTVVNDRRYYQGDKTHLTPAGYKKLGAVDGPALNAALGVPVPPEWASVIIV